MVAYNSSIAFSKGPLNKFRGPAAQGCAAIFQRHKSLENGANRKSRFSICVVREVQEGLIQTLLKEKFVKLMLRILIQIGIDKALL